jgi:glycosyltransferase involved in cell wall biosynthesis
MNEEKLISVIIPAYNAEKYIAEAIESVLKQSHKSLELIVINDGSIDKTESILQRYLSIDSRIRYYNQNNSGESMARVSGLKYSKGEYVYFLDADDIALAETLENLVKKLSQNSNSVAAYGDYLRVNNLGELIYPEGKNLNDLHKKNQNFLESILESSYLAVGSVLIRKEFLNETDILNDTDYSEDWIMFVNIAYKGKFEYVNSPLVKRRIHKNSQTQTNLEIEVWLKAVEIVFQNEKLNIIFPQSKIDKLKLRREAFCYFSIACKLCSLKKFEEAEGYLRKSIKLSYWKHIKVWLFYFLVKIKWLPKNVLKHFG